MQMNVSGTPAARMKKVRSNVVKNRSRILTTLFESFTPYQGMEGQIETIWITEYAADEIHLVGHTKGYIQVLVIGPETMLGTSTQVKITSVGRWSVFGEVIGEPLTTNARPPIKENPEKETCCSGEAEACGCAMQSCGDGAKVLKGRSLVGWFLRKRFQANIALESKSKKETVATQKVTRLATIDWILIGGMVLSLLTIVALLLPMYLF